MSKFSFEEQAKYFEKKLNLKTNSYLDILGEEHDYFFVVAGANRNEVLSEFRKAVDDAIHNGETLENFRKRFDEIVAKTGWEYNGGRNWRTRIIYDTNVYGAYNRGRLQQHLELAEDMPYWEYQHNDNAHPRPQHVAWDGLVLRYDNPFWKYHYPIKAYGCHCTVQALDDFDLKHDGKKVSPTPEIEFEQKTVGVRTGNPRVVTVPKGVDVGFTPHNFDNIKAGRNASIDSVLMQKLASAEPKFASLLVENVLQRPQAVLMLNAAMKEMVDTVASEKIARGQMKYVGVLSEDVIDKLTALDKTPQSAVIAVRDSDILHALRDSKQNQGISLPVEFWEQLPEKLRTPQAILLQSKEQQRNKNASDALLFIYETEKGKVAIKMDYEVKIKDMASGKKTNHKLNMIATGSVFKDTTALYDFELIGGSLD
ncbi:phage minor head protein [Mannheimia sp. AT1]|uniref:Phage minor head protein n=1 Tax=Mannheimia cairinae TaxID=3025936 RepID=A0ABT5MQC0_9PAST|nr:phage minor head protein [Mannheimia cairinae]MDD0824367.1 phage minor head protein [Mannheimia cairinae]MDD0826510.1 phage minor head protein [Mannheimia cairinae]